MVSKSFDLNLRNTDENNVIRRTSSRRSDNHGTYPSRLLYYTVLHFVFAVRNRNRGVLYLNNFVFRVPINHTVRYVPTFDCIFTVIDYIGRSIANETRKLGTYSVRVVWDEIDL